MRVWVVVGILVVGGVVGTVLFRNPDAAKEQPPAPVLTAKVAPVSAAVQPKLAELPPETPKAVTPPPESELPLPKLDIPRFDAPTIPPPALPATPPESGAVVPPLAPVIPPGDPKLPQSVSLLEPTLPPPDLPRVDPPAAPPKLEPLAPPKVTPPEPEPIPPVVLPIEGQNSAKPMLPKLPGEGAIPPLPDLGTPVPKSELPSPAAIDPLVASPPAPTPSPSPKFVPLDAVPGGHAAAAVNQPRVRLKYEVTKAGPSGVGTVELWLKDKNGWSRAAGVKSGDPLEAELPLDGVYGVKVVPVSGQGVRGPEPEADGGPDVWIIRDTTVPAVSLKVTPAPAKDGKPPAAPFVVEVSVRDANLDCAKLGFGWTDATANGKPPEIGNLFTGEDLTKAKIETKIGTFERRKTAPDEPGVFAAVFDWTPSADVPARVVLTAAATDRAGNKAAGRAELGTDLVQPAAKVVGVQVVPGK